MPQTLDIRKPDDWHLHLRDGAMLRGVVGHSAGCFARALVMPNLVPPVATGAQALAYRKRILDALPAGSKFAPLMTLYLTEQTDPSDVARAHGEGVALAVKLYPAGATTNSQSGVRDLAKVEGVLEKMSEIGMPLCVHGEVTDPSVDIFDREAVFIERVLDPLRKRIPELKIVLEHVTTKSGIDYICSARSGLAATLTVHHLAINRNAMFKGGMRPHYYCLPVAKREKHRLALREAAVSGDKRFFLGTDSAPHADEFKETACGCAGIFTAPNAIAVLAQVFEQEGALDRLEGFTSVNGANFYGLPLNEPRIRITRRDTPSAGPTKIETDAGPVTVFDPEIPVYWEVSSA